MAICAECGEDPVLTMHDKTCSQSEYKAVIDLIEKLRCPVCLRTDLIEIMGWKTCPIHGAQRGMNGKP